MGCQLATLRVADGQGLTRVMGDWDWRCFKSLYGCSSSLPVRERQFLPTKRQISLCTCLLMRVFVTVLFPFSACLSRTHCLFNFSFSKLTVWFLSNVREVHLLLHGLQRREAPPRFAWECWLISEVPQKTRRRDRDRPFVSNNFGSASAVNLCYNWRSFW